MRTTIKYAIKMETKKRIPILESASVRYVNTNDAHGISSYCPYPRGCKKITEKLKMKLLYSATSTVNIQVRHAGENREE